MKPEPKLSPEGQATYDDLLKRFSPAVVSTPTTGSVDLGALEVTADLFKEEIQRATSEFDAWKFDAARDRFLKLAEQADRISSSDAAINEVRMRSRSGASASMLNLQDTAGARKLLEQVEERFLTETQRANLSRMLVLTGDIERAASIASALPESTPTAIAARQLVSLAQGDDEIGEIHDPLVALRFCERQLVLQNPAAAAEGAMRLLSQSSDRDLLANGLFCMLMTACCLTLFEQFAPGGGMSREQLERAVLLIEAYEPPASMPDELRLTFVRSAFQYSQVTIDYRLQATLRARFPTDLEKVVAGSSEAQAEGLAKDGAMSEAIGLVAGDAAGWKVQTQRYHLMALGGDAQAAASGLMALATRYPHRFPLETLASELALNQDRVSEALAHAENAFAIFPNVGARLLVARAAVQANEADKALGIAPESVANDPAFLQVLAQASDLRMDPRAVEFWERYLGHRPDHQGARISWAIALSRSGEHERAAEAVAEIITAPSDALTVDGMIACGQLQLAASPTPERKARVRRVADIIHNKFGNDPEVQLRRFSLLADIGEQQEVKLDYKRLEKLGHVRSVNMDELLATFRERADAANAANRLYGEGCLTVEALIRLTHGRTASFVSELLAGRRLLRTATLPHRDDRVGLTDRRVLISLLELILIEHLGVFEQVVEFLGNGRLVMFKDVWDQLIEDTVFLQQVTQTEDTKRLSEIATRIATNSKYELVRAGNDDQELAAAREAPYVSLGDGPHDIGWLAGVLITRATGPVANARAFAHRYARNVPTVGATAIPAVVQLDQAVLEGLALHGLLESAERAFERILVGPSSLRMLEARRNGLNNDLQAMTLMQSLKRTAARLRTRGVLEVVERPRVPAIEALAIDKDKAEWTRLTICEPLAYKQWLINEPDGARMTAEYVGSLVPQHPELWRSLPWPRRDAAVGTWHTFRETSSREWTLVELIRAIPDDALRESSLAKLRTLGFQEALDAGCVLALADAFGRLDVGEGAAVLDRLESLVADQFDPWAGLARMRIASTYAGAIWGLIKKDDSARAVQLTRELLDRAIDLGVRARARMAELLIGDLLLMAISDPMSSLTADETGSTMRLRQDGAVVDVWLEIRRWSEEHEERAAVCRRAISQGWVKLHEYIEAPHRKVNWAPLLLATDKLLPGTNVERVPEPDAVVAILSALWEERPLEQRAAVLPDGSSINLEKLLEIGAARLKDREVSGVDESTARFPCEVGGQAIHMLAPAEALLLRASPELRSGAARDLAGIVGRLDGGLYATLLRFAERPEDAEVQSSLALAACTSPFRLIRDDPGLLSFWGEPSNTAQQGHLAHFDELLELLSEPDSIEVEYAREVKVRSETGLWASRRDAGDLVQLAGRVPGRCVITVAAALVEGPPPGLWNEITETLTQASTAPIGLLAQAVAVAGLGPFVGKVEKAPAELGDLLRRTLQDLDSDEGKQFAVVEAKCLALVERVVLRLAGIRPVPRHQIHWLTFRLYEWWCQNSTLAERSEVCRTEVGRDDLHAFRVRTVLNVLLDVCEMVSASTQRRPSHLDSVTELLFQRASDDPWTGDAFESYWKRPQGGGWLAASILLWLSPSHFKRLPPKIRLRVFENLPVQTEPFDVHALPYVSFLEGIVANIDSLSDEEARAMRAWLDRLGDKGIAPLWKLHIWTGLVAQGDESQHEALQTLVEREASGGHHAWFVGHYVGTLARRNLTHGLVEWLAKVSDGGGRVAAGIVDAWRKDPDGVAPVKDQMSHALLDQSDSHSQTEGVALRDATISPEKKEPEPEAQEDFNAEDT